MIDSIIICLTGILSGVVALCVVLTICEQLKIRRIKKNMNAMSLYKGTIQKEKQMNIQENLQKLDEQLMKNNKLQHQLIEKLLKNDPRGYQLDQTEFSWNYDE